MIKFLSLGSGSKGNATLVYDEKTVLLFDMGLALKVLEEGLSQIGRKLSDIQAVFVTHDHSDHIKGLQYLHDVDIYCSPKTKGGNKIQEVGETIEIGDFKVTSFPTSHDTENPVGYWIENRGTTFCYITDTGILKKTLIKKLRNATYYLLECNHDLKMLEDSNRPQLLKERISGRKGHLSNIQSAEASIDLMGENTKAFYLAHRSEECNTEECMLSTYASIYEQYGIPLSAVKIVILKQWEFVGGGDE